MLRREWDIPQKNIAESVRRNVRTKNQRKATVNNLGKASKVEELMESTGRKVKRFLTFQPPISVQVKKLEAQANEAQRRRSQLALEKIMASEYGSESSANGNGAEVGDTSASSM